MANKRGDFGNTRIEKPSIDMTSIDFRDEESIRSAFSLLATQVQDVSDELERVKRFVKLPSAKRRRD